MSLSDETYGETAICFGPPLEGPPRRVISLVPGLTQSLLDLALGDCLIGLSDACPGVGTAVRLGHPGAPDLEQIVALSPDLVLMDRDSSPPEIVAGLQAAGIRGWLCHPQTVQQAINLLWEIMDVFEEPAMVERVRWIERQMEWTLNAATACQPTRVLAPLIAMPDLAAIPASYASDLLHICGGESILQRNTGVPLPGRIAGSPDRAYIQLIVETALQHQPEVILLPGVPWPFSQQDVLELARLDIPAARSGRIHLIDGTLLTWYGTRMAQALAELPPLLHPTP